MSIKSALETPLEENESVIARMDPTGDTTVKWNRNNPTETAIARAAFDQAKRDRYVAYKVEGRDGLKGEVLGEFDPNAERIILAPPMQGGR